MRTGEIDGPTEHQTVGGRGQTAQCSDGQEPGVYVGEGRGSVKGVKDEICHSLHSMVLIYSEISACEGVKGELELTS